MQHDSYDKHTCVDTQTQLTKYDVLLLHNEISVIY